jgi:PhzF family phenazine biosynthesis protein
MIELKMYQIDAFTDEVFLGNPAAVIPLDRWLPDRIMQSIALENNLPETAFIVPADDGFDLRWFTPTMEVDLCGHATLATAYVVFTHLRPDADHVTFRSRSGPLKVDRRSGILMMNFPALEYQRVPPPALLLESLGITHCEVYRSLDYLVVVDSEEQLLALQPRQDLLTELDLRGVIVSAPGKHVDFSSRFFAPKLGIPEDPITGSAHCALVPYWASRLEKEVLRARQYSRRLGEWRFLTVSCTFGEGRVVYGGPATPYLQGMISVPGELA